MPQFADSDALANLVGYDGVEPARLTRVIEAASSAVNAAAAAVGADLVDHTDVTETFDGNGADVLLVAWPTVDVDVVTLDGDTVDVEWSRHGELERDSGVWTAGRRNVTVTYSYGYAAVDIPEDIADVTLEVAARMLINPQALQQLNSDGMNARFTPPRLTTDEATRIIRAIG